MWWYYIFYRNIFVITCYDFRYNFIKVFGVADIFRYPVSIRLELSGLALMEDSSVHSHKLTFVEADLVVWLCHVEHTY